MSWAIWINKCIKVSNHPPKKNKKLQLEWALQPLSWGISNSWQTLQGSYIEGVEEAVAWEVFTIGVENWWDWQRVTGFWRRREVWVLRLNGKWGKDREIDDIENWYWGCLMGTKIRVWIAGTRRRKGQLGRKENGSTMREGGFGTQHHQWSNRRLKSPMVVFLGRRWYCNWWLVGGGWWCLWWKLESISSDFFL